MEHKFYNSRLLVLHGESGVGKTSLIRAGLMPRLDPESYIPVYVRMLQEPLNEIKRELFVRSQAVRSEAVRSAARSLRSAVEEERDSTALRSSLQTERDSASLCDVLQAFTEHVSKTVILVLDQFEEFFLRFADEVRQQVIAELAACVHASRLDVKFIIALRSDYFAHLAELEAAIPQIFTHQLQLLPLTETQALDAVLKPPQQVGMQIDEAMVQIKLLPELAAAHGSIEPPLLQIVCDALYQHARNAERHTIGMADYEAIGDVHGALRQYLDNTLRQFGQRQPQARAVLKTLITTEGTKQVAFLPELVARLSSIGMKLIDTELQQHYLEKFVNYRLVRVDEVEGRARYELSHDYVAKHIAAWIADRERDVTKALELVDRAYETYQATGVLLERSALQMLKPFEAQLVLLPEKQTFVARSQMQVKKQRRGLWLKVAAALMAVALVVGGVLGYQTYQAYQETLRQKTIAENKRQEAEEQRKRAEEQTQTANINEVEALCQSSFALFLSGDDLGALFAGVKAGKLSQQLHTPIALKNQIILNLQEIVNIVCRDNRLKGHEKEVSSISFSPDGKLLASGSQDNTIKL